jgi:tetratricopeptide (TPR) repeat protein
LTLDTVSFIYISMYKYKESLQLQLRRLSLEKHLTQREELYDLYMSLAESYTLISDYRTAMMWFGRAWSNAQTMESSTMLFWSMVKRMHVWRQWDRWEQAREVAQEALHLVEQYQQDKKRQVWALEVIATIAYWRGNTEEGDHYTHRYQRLIDQNENPPPEASINSKSGMRMINLAREDWVQATAEYQAKLRRDEPFPTPSLVATLAELLVITGGEEQASMCERAIALAEESGAHKIRAIALRARGRLHLKQDKWKLAEADLRQSLQLCEALDLPWEQGNTLYQLGQLYQRRADDAEDKPTRRNADLGRARYHFEQALGFFESLGAQPSVERVRAQLL